MYLRSIFFMSLSLLFAAAKGQGVFLRKSEARPILLFDIGVKRQFPGGDLSARFGKDASLGLDVNYKTASNWLFGLGGHFMFGNEVKERGVLDSLKGSTGEIFDENGQFAVVGLDERGMQLGFQLGKIFTLGGVNKNSGLYVSLGAGYLQHRIRIYSTKTVPQLNDEYKKGYDRLSGGFASTQYLGYRFLDPRKRLNFSIGLEFTQGFTKNLRAYNFDTRTKDTQNRMDLLYSLKLSMTVPIYLKNKNEEEFFE